MRAQKCGGIPAVHSILRNSSTAAQPVERARFNHHSPQGGDMKRTVGGDLVFEEWANDLEQVLKRTMEGMKPESGALNRFRIYLAGSPLRKLLCQDGINPFDLLGLVIKFGKKNR